MFKKLLVVVLTIVSYASMGQAVSSGMEAKTSDVIVKFNDKRLVKVNARNFSYIQGRITARIRTKLNYFTKPILRVVLLMEENGARIVRDLIITEPNVEKRVGITSVNATYIEELSSKQSEVNAKQYVNVSYVGEFVGFTHRHGIKGSKYREVFGFAKFDKEQTVKMVGYRLEMWQKGECVAVHDTISSSAVKRLKLPEDWHVSFKYPDKFKYPTKGIVLIGN